jgi:hypothetical protein
MGGEGGISFLEKLPWSIPHMHAQPREKLRVIIQQLLLTYLELLRL